MFVTITLLLAMSDVLWTIEYGRLGVNPKRPGEVVWSRGAGGPGGVPLGQRHFRDIRRIDVVTGTVTAKVTVAKELSFNVDQVHAWDDALIVVDYVGVGRRVSIRKGLDPLSMKAAVREFPHIPYDRDGRKTCAMTVLGWVGEEIVVGSRAGERPSQAYRVAVADLSIRVIDLPTDADETRVCGGVILVRRGRELRGYSYDRGELWRTDTNPGGEFLPDFLCTRDAKHVITLLSARKCDGFVEARGIVARDVKSGGRLWEREIPQFQYLRHIAIGAEYSAVIYNTHDQFESDGKYAGARWSVYDANGIVIVSDSTLTSQGKSADLEIDAGVAIDEKSGDLVIGSSDGGVFIDRASAKTRAVALPGSPRALSNGVAVCENGQKLVAIAVQ